MSVADGQPVSAAITNPAFLKPDVDDYTQHLLGSRNSTGNYVEDFQTFLNNIASTIGLNVTGNYTAEADHTGKTYNSTSNAVPNGTTFKAGIGLLSNKFAATTISGGHAHTGVDGDGPQIQSTSIANFNNYAAEYQAVTITGISGVTSSTVTTFFAGKTSGGAATTEGVITDPTENFVDIRVTGTGVIVKDTSGRKVYGRITFAASVWTLSFYVNNAGSETAATVTGTNSIAAYYRQVFKGANIPTIPASTLYANSKDPTTDIPSAAATIRGLMDITAQTFAGAKTFNATLAFMAALYGALATDSTTTGANATLGTPPTFAVRVSNASLTSISQITAPSPDAVQCFILMNVLTTTVTLKNATGTAGNQILTGTGADLDVAADACVFIIRDTTTAKWRVIGGAGGGGSVAPDLSNFTGTTLTPSNKYNQRATYTGSSAQTFTAFTLTNIQDGAEVEILGTSDTNSIAIPNSLSNIIQNGDWTGYQGSVIRYRYSANLTKLVEVFRNDI